MKYQLINKQTKEEHLCDKVTIDGFDYYVSNSFIKQLKPGDRYYTIVENPRRLVQYSKYIKSEDIVVIATNNSNIDIPQVVDEVEELAQKECMCKTNTCVHVKSYIKGYNKSQETHPFSEEDMIEFYEWADTSQDANLFWMRNRISPDMNGSHNEKIRQKSKELLQFWKEKRPIKVYYGTD